MKDIVFDSLRGKSLLGKLNSENLSSEIFKQSDAQQSTIYACWAFLRYKLYHRLTEAVEGIASNFRLQYPNKLRFFLHSKILSKDHNYWDEK